MNKITSPFHAALVGTISVAFLAAPIAAQADTPTPSPTTTPAPVKPRFVMEDLTSASASTGCVVIARSVTKIQVLHCGETGLALRHTSGKVVPLTNKSENTVFTPAGSAVINARGMVATAGSCTIAHPTEPITGFCLGRWDSKGTLTVRMAPSASSASVPTAMNIHGDVLTLGEDPNTNAPLALRSAVWWVNNKFTRIETSTPGTLVLANSITDGRDVFGTELQQSAVVRSSSTQDVTQCLGQLVNDPRTLIKARGQKICVNEGAVPIRWKQGTKAQALKGMPDHSVAVVGAASASGNHVLGMVASPGGVRNVHWAGTNAAPTFISEIPQDNAMRIARFVNNHNQSLLNELDLTGGGFSFKGWVNMNGVASELSSSVAGFPSGQNILGDNIDRDGNIFALMSDESEAGFKAVLLKPVK